MSDLQATRLHAGAAWHKESFDRFISEALPRLLARRLPLTAYAVHPIDAYTCRVGVAVNEVEVEYTVLQPDEEGLFRVDGRPFVVVPVASCEDLAVAEIKCVGEQMHDHIGSQLGEAFGDLPWDEQLVRAWLPLDTWVREIVTSRLANPTDRWATGQPLDTTNGTAARTHLRRIVVPEIEKVITPSQFGRVCPFEVPEGPNVGRVFTVAVGAEIRGGRIEIVDDRPEAGLGLSASMVPFLEHNDPNRQTFGVNMMRQWLVPPDPEPALVQTGNEPDSPQTWCGRNLLTAFISYGAETYEDGILISESCAKRLSYPDAVRIGDKISNRHGTKGVVSRILPDDEMPHLPDGTPMDLVYSFIGIHSRLNLGQVREAVVGRIARAEGEPVIVPPFSAPSETELRERLSRVGLPDDGMEVLRLGRDGRKMERRSTVGWVYWGRTCHTAASKIHACVAGPLCNRQGELEYHALRDLECFENIASAFNTCSADRADLEDFVAAVETGPVEQAGPPTPRFTELRKRLSAGGVEVELSDRGLSFTLGPPSGGTLRLAQAVPHPWLRGHTLAEIGVVEESPEYHALAESNAKMQRALAGDVPASLKQQALSDLEDHVRAFFDALLRPEQLRLGNRVLFSGRTVAAPAVDLQLDQVGLSDEIAWTIFGPLVTRELGDRSHVEQRTDRGARALDRIMTRSWVIINRAPTLIPTALMAFRPVRIPDPVIRLHPLICFLMNADFDGDQVAVFLPIAEAAQREAAEKLSLAGHLRRDPNLYGLRLLLHEALWGLAQLGLAPGGLEEIAGLASGPVALAGELADRDTVAAALREIMPRDGVDAVIQAMQRLMQRGLQVAKASGASISPFVGSSLACPPPPEGDDPDRWSAYVEEVTDTLQSQSDFSSPDLGPQLLSVRSGARGSVHHLLRLTSPSGIVNDAAGRRVAIRHSLRDGLAPDELFACVAGAREGLARLAADLTQRAYGVGSAVGPTGFGVLARAMRASHPGPVFARAAAAGERDPLTETDSRLFVGLGPIRTA